MTLSKKELTMKFYAEYLKEKSKGSINKMLDAHKELVI